MLLTFNPLTTSLALAGTGRVIPPLERIHGLIDQGAQIDGLSEAAQLISRFNQACTVAKVQELLNRTTTLDDWGKQILKGKGDATQWLTNINIFFQDLQAGDDDAALEQLAANPEAVSLLFQN